MEHTTFWTCHECRQGYSGVRNASNPFAPLGQLVCWSCANAAKVGIDPEANRADRRRAARHLGRAGRMAYFGRKGDKTKS